MENFQHLALPQPLIQSLERIQFRVPTPIQVQAIPPALEGKDILGSAQTGTGKTGAFGIPLISRLILSPHGSALVITPTRELAVQVMKMLESFIGKQNQIKSALLIGGESISKQLQQLRRKPRVIVGTPGRINDHLVRNSQFLRQTDFLVLDETDRMLDSGFTPQIEKILEYLSPQRQTLLFSATLPKNILLMAKKYLNDPVRISVGSLSQPVVRIKQEALQVSKENKYDQLIAQLLEREGSILVFVKTKWGADKMAKRLCREGHSAEAIHGDLRQNKRERVINAFRKRKYRILVATDIAARGLDIPHIEHVINFDLPQCPEDYVHRIGRTARAGATGSALCFITPADRGKWNLIQRLMNPEIKLKASQKSSSFKKKKKPFTASGAEQKPSFKKKKKPFAASEAEQKPSFKKKKKPFATSEAEQKPSFKKKKKPFAASEAEQKPSFKKKKKPFATSEAEQKPSFKKKKKPFAASEAEQKPSFKKKKKNSSARFKKPQGTDQDSTTHTRKRRRAA